MTELLIWWIAMSIGFSIITVKEDRYYKKIADGYNPNARDGDGDGIVQEGTKWERKK
jgi:hypothetical protein